jgi:two-component system chemotaxis response regulator CheB
MLSDEGPRRDIVTIGASAGGVEALKALVTRLPADLPAAILVVLHISGERESILHDILDRAGPLAARRVADGEEVQPGRIYVARPDLHLMVEGHRIRLQRGPRENRSRPSVDVLFRSAARAYGARVLGIVLTGSLSDGTPGLLAIKRRGGVGAVQDPAEAAYPDMPTHALENVPVDYVLPLAGLSALIVRGARQGLKVRTPVAPAPHPAGLDRETEVAEMENRPARTEDQYRSFAVPSTYACPDCNGVLWEVQEPEMLRFRCRVGHAYTAQSLLEGQDDQVESALWEALRSLEEGASLSRRMASRSAARGMDHMRYDERARELEAHVGTLRRILGAAPKDDSRTAQPRVEEDDVFEQS